MANVTIAINNSNNDIAYDESGATWVDIVPGTDYLVFSAGSDIVDDDHTIPSQTDLMRAGVVLTGVETIVDRYFLADISTNKLKEIFLMGNVDAQYVMAFSFDAATATEPTLELWDDTDLDTITGTTLGAGTAANSWWKGICTTTSSSGVSWTGSALAGASAGRFLYLNDGNGALSVATVLYCNLKIVIPSSATVGSSATPVFAIKYASN